MKLLELAPGRWAHPSGALWLDESRTALLADVHLGYGWALRRRRQLGPVQDKVQQKLIATIADLKPRAVVFVGDVVHAPRPGLQERASIETALHGLSEQAELILIPGNHDRRFLKDYPGAPVRVASEWRQDGLVAVHGHILPTTDDHLIVGHIHPALGVVDHAGATQKLPVFLTSKRVTVLPAFSPLSAGCDIRVHMPAELSELLGDDTQVIAASGKRVVSLGSVTRLNRLPSAW